MPYNDENYLENLENKLAKGKKTSEIDTQTQRLIDHFKATINFVESITENDILYMKLFIASRGEAPDIAEAMKIGIPTAYTYRSSLIKKTHFKDPTSKTTNDGKKK